MIWDARPDGIYVSGDPEAPLEEYEFLCKPFSVVAKHVDLQEGVEDCEISLETAYCHKIFRVDRAQFTLSKIFHVMMRQGLYVLENDNARNLVLEVLLDSEQKAPVIFHHSELGFRQVQNKTVFLGHHPVGPLDEAMLTSTYAGHQNFAPKGTLKQWRRFVLKHLVRRPELCLVLALGATAPVAYVLRAAGVFPDVPLWALIGDSSTGKTTALNLLSSFWASSNSMVHDFNATENAFFAMLEEHAGIPFLADEATYAQNIDWDYLLYTVPAGRGKRRYTTKSKLTRPVEFSGSVFVTSEISILERSLQHKGQLARIVEFSKDWAGSAELADKISKFCTDCYGWAGPEVVKLLMEPGFTSKLIKRYNIAYQRLIAEVGGNLTGVDHRLLKRFALILTSAWTFQKALRISIQPQALEHMLLADYRSTTAEIHAIDPADALLQKFAEEVLGNQGKYPPLSGLTGKGKFYRSTDLRGATGYYGNVRCVWFLEEHFRRVVKNVPGLGVRSACYKLLAKGYIVRYYGDRFLKEEDFGVLKAGAYCVLFPDSTSLSDELSTLGSMTPTTAEAAKHLNGDPFGAMCDYSSLATCAQDTPSDLLTIAIEWHSAQEARLVIYDPLYRKLNLHSRVHLAPLFDKGIFLLSDREIVSDRKPLTLEHLQDQHWHEGPMITRLIKEYGIDIPLYHRAIFTDIAVEEQNGLIAVINMKNISAIRVEPLQANNSGAKKDNDINISAGKLVNRNAPASKLIYLLTEDADD